jgi:RNA 3'-terminal phosphate cyclase
LPLKKSDTYSIALPNISKTQVKIASIRTARANTTRHHSVFLEKIKDLTKDVRY